MRIAPPCARFAMPCLMAFSTMSCRISAGNRGEQQIRGDIDTDLKALHKAHLLDVKILLRKLHFLSQRHLLPGRVLKKPAQKIAQPGNHAHRGIVPSLTYQPAMALSVLKRKWGWICRRRASSWALESCSFSRAVSVC